jgi:hypothetical protein
MADVNTPCHRKVGYLTAEKAISAAIKSIRETGAELRIYACPHCKRWHLTSKPLGQKGRGDAKRVPGNGGVMEPRSTEGRECSDG